MKICDGLGLHFVMVYWCIATFASYILVVVFAFLMMIAYVAMYGLDFYHKLDENKMATGLAACATFMVFFSLVALAQSNYYV